MPAVDATAPSVSITAPSNGSTVIGTADLTVTATDNSGVTGVTFYSGSSVVGKAQLTSGVWVYRYNTATLPVGSYSLIAIATDAAGNVGTSAAIKLTVSRLASSVTAPTDAKDACAAKLIPGSKLWMISTCIDTNVTGVIAGYLQDSVGSAVGGAKFYS